MAAPEFVPTKPTDWPRSYGSPPRYDDAWTATRPGELPDRSGQPDVGAGRMGAPGPDQGYVLKLVPLLREQLRLTEGERLADVEAGCVAVALKRASIYGRAPMIEDLKVAYAIWGYTEADAPAELVAERRNRFEGVRLAAHHYPELRAVVDAVPAASLRQMPEAVARRTGEDWRAQLDL